MFFVVLSEALLSFGIKWNMKDIIMILEIDWSVLPKSLSPLSSVGYKNAK